ncbi:hypothetical protein EVAR_25208_1 [Eumeta japonica]|uniref:Beta-hexosaminidase eukaryotic type N-terminal domain-containing protein n=1 Tax=Eumeta variegata TaxID=151549 RepID=A0A4C1WH61_EUMVA|nr:hypothetical protein EVAR_25208_1 [Eumeta japonica]
MIRLFVFGALFVVIRCSWIVNPGPLYPATKGEVWPKPQQEEKGNNYFIFNPSEFKFNVRYGKKKYVSRTDAVERRSLRVTSVECLRETDVRERCVLIKDEATKVERGMLRWYSHINRRLHGAARQARRARPAAAAPRDGAYSGAVRELQLQLTDPCEDMPHLDMNETYELRVAAVSRVESASVWGLLRGLESFSQKLYLSDDYYLDRQAVAYVLRDGVFSQFSPFHVGSRAQARAPPSDGGGSEMPSLSFNLHLK